MALATSEMLISELGKKCNQGGEKRLLFTVVTFPVLMRGFSVMSDRFMIL